MVGKHNATSCVPEKPSHDPQTTLKGKADGLVEILDDWKQLYTMPPY